MPWSIKCLNNVAANWGRRGEHTCRKTVSLKHELHDSLGPTKTQTRTKDEWNGEPSVASPCETENLVRSVSTFTFPDTPRRSMDGCATPKALKYEHCFLKMTQNYYPCVYITFNNFYSNVYPRFIYISHLTQWLSNLESKQTGWNFTCIILSCELCQQPNCRCFK